MYYGYVFMILAVDIGNSVVTFGLFEGDDLLHKWAVRTSLMGTSDQYGILLLNLFRHHALDSNIEGAVISSVVPNHNSVITVCLKNYFTKNIKFINFQDSELDIRCLYPEQVGHDLIANVIAALQLYDNDCIIVDHGTALTASVVLKKNRTFLGCVIAPGIESALGGLLSNTAQLQSIQIKESESAYGNDTVTALQIGVYNGYMGLIKEIVYRIQKTFLYPPLVILTGGLSNVINSIEGLKFDAIEPDLTLKGLNYFFGYQTSKQKLLGKI